MQRKDSLLAELKVRSPAAMRHTRVGRKNTARHHFACPRLPTSAEDDGSMLRGVLCLIEPKRSQHPADALGVVQATQKHIGRTDDYEMVPTPQRTHGR